MLSGSLYIYFIYICIAILLLGIGLTFTKLNNITSLLYSTSISLIPAHFLILHGFINDSGNIIFLYSYLLLTISSSVIFHKKVNSIFYLGFTILLLFIAIFYTDTIGQLLPIIILQIAICSLIGIIIMFKLPDSPYNLDDENIDYSAMMENLEDGVMFVDDTGKTFEVNKQWERITGYSKNELVGRNAKEMLLYPDDWEFMDKQTEYRKKGKSNRYDLRIKTKSGIDKWVVTIGMPLLNKSSKVIGSLGIMVDRTEDIKKDQKLLAYSKDLEFSMTQLQKVNKELEQFAAVVSHDLRSPLNTISNFSGLLERRCKDELSEDAQEYLDFIRQGCHNMRNIIDGLLYLAKFGAANMKKEEVKLSDIVHNSILNLDAVIKKNKANISYSDLLSIYCDRVQIQQLLQNLIENSIKYKKTEINPEINISTEKEENGVKIIVKDNGIGIKKEYQDQIFIIFNQLENKNEGIGIGLATCKKIVENHNGKIELNSQLGKGSSFVIFLPND